MDFTIVLLIALAIGIILGFIFERGQFCMTLILTESVFFKNHRRMVGLISAILICTVLFNIAVFLGAVDSFNLLRQVGVNPNFFKPPLVVERSLIGGLIFGFGMILAGGCVAGILFRIGEGQLSSAIALLGLIAGFASAVVLEAIGVVGPERGLYPSGVLLPEILQIPQGFLVALVAALLLVLLLALRRRAGWKVFSAILVIFLLGAATLHYSTRPEIVTPPPPPVQLTGEQIEVDRFVNAFHVTVSNRSVSKIIPFFAEDAVMVLPDGTLIKGIDMIKSYYEEEFTQYRQYILSGKASKIELVDNRATAIYSSGLRVWALGATLPPYIPYREVFTLIRIDDKWKIETLVVTPRGAE